eukprot:jgi/Ulvmu1/5109/UM021_0126.1
MVKAAKAVEVLQQAAKDGAASKAVDKDIQAYQQARLLFVNSIRDHLRKDTDGAALRSLMKADIVGVLCCPLSCDPVQGVQTEALHCVAQLAARHGPAALALCGSGVVDNIIVSQTHQNPKIKEAANQALSSLCKAGGTTAQSILDSGILHCVKQQLDGTDDGIKLAGLEALKNIAQHSQGMAETVADQELLDKSVALLQDPSTSRELQGTVCAMLTACAGHSAELSRRILDSGSIKPLIRLLQPNTHSSTKVQAASMRCLAHLSSHESASAAVVAKAAAGPPAIRLATASDSGLRRPATALLQQLASRTPEICMTVASEGCVTALVAALRLDHGTTHALAPLMALGHISSCAATFARAVIDAGAIPEIATAIQSQDRSLVKGAAWVVQHSAMHGSIICDQYAISSVLPRLVFALQAESTEPDLRDALSTAIKEVVKHCMLPAPLFILISSSVPSEVALAVLSRLYVLLAKSVVGRREFVTTGTIMNLQSLEQSIGPVGQEVILAINSLFPKDLVAYYRTRM